MMASSFAQADICSSSWWSSATRTQIETKGPLAMNASCEDGRMPVDLALENNLNPFILLAILEHFELDEEARHRVAKSL